MEPLLYKYLTDSLLTGASLGNLYTFARLDSQTNLKGLWSSFDDRFYVGEWNIDLVVNDKPLFPQHTLFKPESQSTSFIEGAFTAEKQFFLPYRHSIEGIEPSIELRAAIFLVRLMNSSTQDGEFVVRHSITFPAVACNLFIKQPPPWQMSKKVRVEGSQNVFHITTVASEHEARVLGSKFNLQPVSIDDTKLVVQSKHRLGAGEVLEIPIVLTFSSEDMAQADRTFERCLNAKTVLNNTLAQFDELLNRALVVTPEPVINRGFQWAKVNTVRVQHQYRSGQAFTNDPPQDIIVVRDVAWYVFGADYLTPRFSHNVLSLCEQFVLHENGKVAEFIHANEEPPQLHDYDLNINDDTPLFVLALYHHAAICDDEQYLERVYPLMKKACDRILSQMFQGLVWCTASATNVWGICSWRNIIDDYTLSGAVTEINSECYAALLVTAEAAQRIGKHDDAARYRRSAEQLKEAINTMLVSEKTGLYLLNIGNDGTRHHDITGDLIFPVIFGVADENIRPRILEKLTDKDMWTPYGSRTVSQHEEKYDPDFGYQLIGGIWPNLTAWIAYCLRDKHPERLVEAMKNIFTFCEAERPSDFLNLVPGQFPERLHGETYQSKGMTLSPWMPPTYLWLGVEGLLGIRATLDGLEMNPALPQEWKWIGVKRLPYKGKTLSAFVWEGTLYSTVQVKSRLPVVAGDSIETESDPSEVFSLALEVGGEILLFVASHRLCQGTISLHDRGTIWRKTISLKAGEARLIRPIGKSEMVDDHLDRGRR